MLVKHVVRIILFGRRDAERVWRRKRRRRGVGAAVPLSRWPWIRRWSRPELTMYPSWGAQFFTGNQLEWTLTHTHIHIHTLTRSSQGVLARVVVVVS